MDFVLTKRRNRLNWETTEDMLYVRKSNQIKSNQIKSNQIKSQTHVLGTA
jgi:hypothetical protein